MGIAAATALVAVAVLSGWFWSHLSTGPDSPGQAAPLTVVEDKQPVTESVPEHDPVEKWDPAVEAQSKSIAEAALGAFLEKKNILTAKGVERWDQNAFMEIDQLSREADALFLDRAFETATQKYETAGRKADLLIGGIPEVFQRLLEEGKSALASGESVIAQEKLKTALMIDPQHPDALESYNRARTLDDVLSLVVSGKQHEDRKKYAMAYADYQKAVSLDPLHAAARQGLVRMEAKIKAGRFNQLMSEGLAALRDDKLKIARDRLQKAKSFQPNAPAVIDALQQLEQADLLARINALLQRAKAAEQAEAWDQALKLYLAVLQLEPKAGVAIQGRQRARHHISILKRLDFYLDHPDALESDQQLQNALALQADLQAMTVTSPKIRSKISQFEALLKTAQTPIPVVIQSDDLTEVTIYKVGKMGRFLERRIKLRPGTYTVVGSRDGYQDVRQKLVVRSGQHTVRITIRCQKKI